MSIYKRVLQLTFIIAIVAATSAAFAATTTYSNIDQRTGWQSCGACAGAGGAGATAPYSMTENVSSPSLDGHAAQFFLGGSTPYSNALWWKQLGANAAATNFRYDLYYYIKNPSAAQALEFDVNQSVNGKKYIFGTQCDIKGSHTWDVYDAYNHKWVTTSVACSAPAAYSWQHITLEFQRANGKMVFVAVTVNGQKHYFNRSYSPRASSSSELNVAFQMDGNGSQTDYQVWLDKVQLTAW